MEGRKNMNSRKIKILILVIFIFVISGVVSYRYIERSFDSNRKTSFHKCMNIINAFETQESERRDVTMKAEYFDVIKNAGFDSVRLPIRFSDYVDKETYIFNAEFINEIDYFIDYALQDDLSIILDFHDFEEIMDEPEKYNEMFVSIWNQLSERYKKYPDNLIFELLDEPKNNLRGELWNNYLKQGIETIRKSNKTRKVIIGPDSSYSIDRLYNLFIPRDKNLILTFHYYYPIDFTFQGDEYHGEYEKETGVKWMGTEKDINILQNKFDIVKKYSKENKIPVFLSEFGVNKIVSDPYRWQWIKTIRSEADSYNFSWGYWEFCSKFGIYDLEAHKWSTELRALIPF